MNMKCKRKSQIIAARLPHRVKSAIALLIFVLVAGSAMPAWSETVTYYVTNAQGTVVATIDSKGNVTYTAAYRPYGKQVKGTPQSGPGYTGHVNDPDTGLVYMQQRYYDPEIKRFPSPDPIGPTPGNIYNFNRYAYANNNPLRYTDPDGRSVTCDANSCTISCKSLLECGGDYATVGAIIIARYAQIQYHKIHNNDPRPSDEPTITDRPAQSDGKHGSTGGPGTGKRFRPEAPTVKSGKDGVPCVYCGHPTTNEPGHTNSRERDHIDPKSRGGNNSPDNERDSCRSCNRSKGSKTPEEWEKWKRQHQDQQ